eukprot:1489995-Pyramimonas_sp.AAC.1
MACGSTTTASHNEFRGLGATMLPRVKAHHCGPGTPKDQNDSVSKRTPAGHHPQSSAPDCAARACSLTKRWMA